MNNALEAIRNGLTFREAQRLFNINKHELEKYWNEYKKDNSHLNNNLCDDKKYDSNSIASNCHDVLTELTEVEESILADYLSYVISHGFPFCKEVIEFYIKELGFVKDSSSVKFSLNEGWLERFLNQYNFPINICDSIEEARKQMSCKSSLKRFFALLKKNLETYNLFDKQSQIWFSEENSFEDRMHEKFDFGVGFKHTYLKEVMNKEKIVINLSLNASGKMLPPMIVFGELKEDPNMFSGPKQSLYAFCNKGFDDIELCHQWFRHFLHFASEERPLLLIQDQMSFHLAPSIIDVAKKNDIILLFLPLHCHPILRPLDISLFIQTATVSSDSSFCSVLREAFTSITPEIIVHGFRKNGIFPYDPTQVNLNNVFKVLDENPVGESELKKPKLLHKQLVPTALQNGKDVSDSETKGSFLKNTQCNMDSEIKSDFTSEDEGKSKNQTRARKRRKRGPSGSSHVASRAVNHDHASKSKLEKFESSPESLYQQQSFKEMLKQYPCHQIDKDNKTTYEDVLLYTYNRVCTLKWLIDANLIAESRKCEICEQEMDLQAVKQDSTWQDGFVWACRKIADKSHYICDIRKGSWLQNKNISLEKSIRLTYMWCTGYPQDLIRHELQLPASICVTWARLCREYAADICTKSEEMLGGETTVVEVDLLQPEQFVIGGSDVKSQTVFLTPLIHDNSKVISDILKSWLKKGTAIFPVGWNHAEKLDEEALDMLVHQYNFHFLTQSEYLKQFASPSNWLHTKTALFAKGSVKEEYYWAYFGEFLWRRQCQQQDKFQQFVQHIAQVFHGDFLEDKMT